MTTDLHHDLGREFPELKDKIHVLKTENAHFARLFDEYHQIDREVARIEAEVEPASDAYTEECKKKRVRLKDEIFAMLRAG
ncbi:MAG: YdcH family protein [Alphaproteobacteria bacterium]|nr:YdcH family protein [Alphaproteobacteria bacterium]